MIASSRKSPRRRTTPNVGHSHEGSGRAAAGLPSAAWTGVTSCRRRLRLRRLILVAATSLPSILGVPGCGLLQRIPDGPNDTRQSFHDVGAMNIAYPEVATCATEPERNAQAATKPNALQDPSELPAIEMSLSDAIGQAVRESPVLRSIGGSIVTAPQTARTTYDPALVHAGPNTGVEAALSAFDAQWTTTLNWSSVDQPQNIATGGLGAAFTPTVALGLGAGFRNEISKRTATGAQFAVRNVINYEDSNRPFRQFQTDYVGWLEAEWRQPLLQGAGTQFNRIAGNSGQVGVYNGVLIARVNEDVALADFESAVIQLVADVEQAYWDLATAYRVLEATVKGREAALQTFQYQQVRLEVGTGRSDEEAQARSQFYQFEAQLQNALGGPRGVYALEQQLRYLIGSPATDGSLIKPVTDPTSTKVVFDWDSALGQSLGRRVEIRRQRFNVKRREMELTAARLNRRPRLDVVGQYRWRGLGDDLIGDGDNGANSNLFDSITDGDFQEWGAGIEFSMPVGLRAASNAIAHARLNLNRERAVLAETELRVSHDLSSAARQIELTYQLVETNYNRYLADSHQVDVLDRRYRDGTDNINFLLQAQRQVVTSEIEFYQSLTNYNLALRDFHRQKGSLLAYNNVQMAEGPWAAGATRDAHRAGRFLTPRRSPEKINVPQPVTRGTFDPSAVQNTQAPVELQSPIAPGLSDAAEADTGADAIKSVLSVAPPAGFMTSPDVDSGRARVPDVSAGPVASLARRLSTLNFSDPADVHRRSEPTFGPGQRDATAGSGTDDFKSLLEDAGPLAE